MTQGEILSAFAPLHELNHIFRSISRDEILTTSDVNTIMPFLSAAKDAVEKLSLFALNHFNSSDENKRQLSKIIYDRLKNPLLRYAGCRFKGESPSVDSLNFTINYIDNHIANTIYSYESCLETLPPLKSDDEDSATELNERNKEEVGSGINDNFVGFGEEMIDQDGDIASMQSEKDNNDNDVSNSIDIDNIDTKGNDTPKIFDKRINEDVVIKEIKNLCSDKVKGMRRWYVLYRVFGFLEWLDKPTHSKFILWVQCHFGWEWHKRDFKAIQSELKRAPNEWRDVVIKGKKGKKDNKNIGPDYYEYADVIIKTFIVIDDKGMHDKSNYLIDQKQAILHHNIWK